MSLINPFELLGINTKPLGIPRFRRLNETNQRNNLSPSPAETSCRLTIIKSPSGSSRSQTISICHVMTETDYRCVIITLNLTSNPDLCQRSIGKWTRLILSSSSAITPVMAISSPSAQHSTERRISTGWRRRAVSSPTSV